MNVLSIEWRLTPATFSSTRLSRFTRNARAHTYIARARDRRGAVRGYALLERVLTDFSLQQVLPFDEQAARTFDELLAQRVRIGTMDLRIASAASVRGMIVLTRNVVDFQAVPGLRLEDWTAS